MLLRLIAAAMICFVLDQASKMLVARALDQGQSMPVTTRLKLTRVSNSRGLPLLRSPGKQLLLFAMLMGGICLIVWQGHFFQHPAARLGLGLALGGAGSNLYDQLRHGVVLDFLDLGWWPVFNLADAAITSGVLTALCFLRC